MSKFQLYSDRYLEAIYDKRLNLVELYWKKTTEEMTEAEYRMIVYDTIEIIIDKYKQRKWKAPNWLLDNRSFLFALHPKLQKWQAENIFARVNAIGTQKVAVLMSENVTSQVSIEQTFEESQYFHLRTQYFYNHQQATEWLQEKFT